jgi:hypothetical protein
MHACRKDTFNLQKGAGSEQITELPEDQRPIDFGPEFDGQSGAFMDTAAAMQHLDLVITSDTAITHLAGAMGRPVWVALHFASDWRWLDQRPDSPWYPTMRLFRQTSLGDWDEVFGRIAAELQAVVAGDRSKLRPPMPAITAPLHGPMSPGELLDKLTILEIKSQRLDDAEKRRCVALELQDLRTLYENSIQSPTALAPLVAELRTINERLWEIEDALRGCEAQGDFGPQFVALARAVYTTNDRRVAVKRQIDVLLGSPLLEQKQYTPYTQVPPPA